MEQTALQLLDSTRRPRIGRPPTPLVLDSADEALLEQIASSPFWPAFQARKAKAVLAIANGGSLREVAKELNYGVTSIWRCRDRFQKGGVAALLIERHRTGRRRVKRRPADPLD